MNTNELDKVVVEQSRNLKNKITNLIRKRLGLFDSDRQRHHPIFSADTIEKIAFTLSDQQLITGVSIIIVGFQRHCVMTQYHFYIVYLLEVFSFATHQPTMMILRKKLKLGVVVQCIWADLPQYYNGSEVAFTIVTSVFLFWGFAAVSKELCPPDYDSFKGHAMRFFTPRWWHDLTSQKFEELHLIQPFVSLCHGRDRDHTRGSFRFILDSTLFITYLLGFTLIQIFASRTFDLYRVWATLFYATFAITGIKDAAISAMTLENTPVMNGDENSWGFGQVLPMLLLALPTSQVWEMIWGKIHALTG
ncbi:hypothetical protein TSTA_100580 [Talaromyces stipitatus ATCC 10500]|uniref:Uncharacterized protein n=1 Tax=Talaromyces stipitatus (strain ATCC 10500 / CBS 375.48 / QM 6759 / NRRL 1006) TaxID=441959 RepID=B8MMQ8_TALSN|nr:uncharacterized protein TSTA_100580 [Talaromyces stipitatus ATCC 10500]EED13814.1 hypothetical protein TSTA_100580 [Talaromyces stipitatus ATCC 10500]